MANKKWEMVDKKMVLDSDGFWTEYAMYFNGEKYVFVFGDTELYSPDDESNWDWEEDGPTEAKEWFYHYGEEEDYDEEYYW